MYESVFVVQLLTMFPFQNIQVRGESGGYGQQGTGGVMLKGGLEHQGGTGANVVRVTRETVEINKDTKQRQGG